MKKINYIIKVDPDINQDDAKHFNTRVIDLLNSDKRWPGYEFNLLPSEYNGPNTPDYNNYDFIIVLLERSKKHKLLELSSASIFDQPDKDGYGNKIDINKTEFSYTFYSTPRVVVIDYTNWKELYKSLDITKDMYESYVIFHEVGHAIGKTHKPIPTDTNKPYPIMYQATLGLPDKSRFVSYPNISDDLD